ncbi:hypothetical protein BDW42DRAFT_120687 [Aspergillus taichungensis]|uniref:Uncharacterized protein n=1 Tax=Aspergillus taichungensis TaxID=482145 RepID=A0A2J5I7Y5_9EURO|nr:hypothetical protein BDW42DRAFT_120687 [Aspergillus taichungensis]
MASPVPENEEAPLPCPSWIFSTIVAKDRCWFNDDYIPFGSYIEESTSGKIKSIGFGSVDIPTKTAPTRRGPSSHGILHLENVLHVPGAFCNIIGEPLVGSYMVGMEFSKNRAGSISSNPDGRAIAYFKPLTPSTPLPELRLSGPPIGPVVGRSPFEPSDTPRVHARWPDSERRRFGLLYSSGKLDSRPKGSDEWKPGEKASGEKASGQKVTKGKAPRREASPQEESRQVQGAAVRPLTPEETAWMKNHFGSEFKFLLLYNLKIYNEEDRQEGRAILRALMSDVEDEFEIKPQEPSESRDQIRVVDFGVGKR